jgi:hypothetical protein
MGTGHYTPETYQHFPADKLLGGLERQEEGALANVIVWRAIN